MAVAANTHFPVAADVEIKFVRAPTKILQDPQECPVTVIGQLSNLQKVKFENVGTRLAGCVDSPVNIILKYFKRIYSFKSVK